MNKRQCKKYYKKHNYFCFSTKEILSIPIKRRKLYKYAPPKICKWYRKYFWIKDWDKIWKLNIK